jgi:hypothetical protein
MTVEALDRTTAKVVKYFSLASIASFEISSGFLPYLIIQACESKRQQDRECKGFYWRFEGSRNRILRIGEGMNEGIPIEQVDLKTEEIIETFSSSRKAYEKTGVSRCAIKQVLERRGQAAAVCYCISGDLKEKIMVEKLDLDT